MKQIFASLAAAAALAMGAASASAQGTNVTDGQVIQPDGVTYRTNINAMSTQSWLLYTNAMRSYVIEVTAIEGTPKDTLFVDFVALNGGGILPAGWTFVDRTSTEPKLDGTNAGINGKRRVLTTTTLDGPTGLVDIRVTCTSPGFKWYQIRVVDTTLFSPAWSTNGTYETYFSFFNTTNTTLSGTLVLTKADGTTAGTMPLTLLPGRATPTNTAAMAIPDGTGTATFVHDGPAGSVLAESTIANFSSTPAFVQYVNFKAREYFR